MLQKIKDFLTEKSINSPIRTLLISLGLTLFIFSGFKNFHIESDLVKIFPQNLSSKLIWDDIQNEFGETEFIIVAFGRENHNILNDPIAISSSQLFTNAMLDTNIIQNLDKVISLSTFNKISGDENELTIGLLQDENFLQYIATSDSLNIKKSLDDMNKYFDNNEDDKQRLISQNNDYLNISIRPIADVDYSQMVPIIKQVAYQYLGDYDIHFAGQPYIAGETPKMIQSDVSLLMVIGIIIMFIILLINLRSVYAVFIIIMTILCSLLSMVGFMGWMRFLTGSIYFDFTVMNTSMPIILLTIANSDGVHIVSRFFREIRKEPNQNKALQTTMRSLIQPIFLTSITTAAAFITMISSPLEYMIGYSFGIAFGVMWAFFLSCTMLPSFISLKKWSIESQAISKESIVEKLTAQLSKIVIHKPKSVLLFGIFIIFISFIGVWLIKVEVNIIKFYKPGHPIRESTNFVDENFSGTMNLSIALESDLTDYDNYLMLYKLQRFLEENQQINMTFSAIDILKSSYTTYTGSKFDSIPNQNELDGTYSMLAYTDKTDLEDDLITLLGKDYDPFFDTVDKALLTAMIKTISTEEIQELVNETNAYIDQNIKSTNNQNEIKISGLSVFISDFVNIIVKSSITSIILSIVLILTIIWLFFRSLKWGVLAIIPLTSAVILNFGLMGLLGIELNHMTALLSSVIIGVGVDFSIHYISDYRRNIIQGVPSNEINKKTSGDVGYPILLDVASNMGFISLFFSALIPLNHMGGLMVLAMLSTSFGTLTILASLIQILNIKKI